MPKKYTEDCMRLGVMLTPHKVAIFDRIQTAGDEGVTSHQLLDIPPDTVIGDRNSRRLKSHISDINLRLEETEYVIKTVGDRVRRPDNGYFQCQPYKLVRREQPSNGGPRRARLIKLSLEYQNRMATR
jgi:hypothetical protein